jgi:hypothetical protein
LLNGFRKTVQTLALRGVLAVVAGWLSVSGSPVFADVADAADGLYLPGALKDQHGNSGGLDRQSSQIQIAIVVSAKRLRRIKPWEKALFEYDDSLQVIRVADVVQSTPVQYQQVADKLRKRLPEDVNVLIDVDGIWVKAFDLDSSHPSVLIFDGAGRLLAKHEGMYKRRLFPALQADLEQIQAELPSQLPSPLPSQLP